MTPGITAAAPERPRREASLRHLSWLLIDARIHARSGAGSWLQDPADLFRGSYPSDAEAACCPSVHSAPVGGRWPLCRPKKHKRLLRLGGTSRPAGAPAEVARQRQALYGSLAAVFGLTFDLDAMPIHRPPPPDLRQERAGAHLQDDVTRKWPTVSLAPTWRRAAIVQRNACHVSAFRRCPYSSTTR